MKMTNEKKNDVTIKKKTEEKKNVRWLLIIYDLAVFIIASMILLVIYRGTEKLSVSGIVEQMILAGVCVFSARLIGNIYGQVWRYGGIQCYIRLLATDSIAFLAYFCLELLLPISKVTFARMLSLISMNLLGALAMRMMYRYAYKCGNQENLRGKKIGDQN